MSPLVSSIIANTFISLLSLLGAITLIRNSIGSKKLIATLVSFAAGTLIGASFFDLLPETLEFLTVETAFLWVLIGIVVSFLIERFLLWYHHHHDDSHNIKPSAYLVLFGDTIHNLIDGVAITAAFLVNPAVGISTTLAIAAHEIPQELADFSVLLHAGMKRKRALLLNLLTALTAILGAIVSYFFLAQSEALTSYALAITAGMFIYIALADLVPDLHHKKSAALNIAQSAPFIIGILLMFIISQTTPHNDHGEPIEDQELTAFLYKDMPLHVRRGQKNVRNPRSYTSYSR